jgi:perosamine synthetase
MHSYQSFMVVLEGPWCRRAVMQHLFERGIDSRRGVSAIHRTPAYRRLYPGLSLPVSEHLARRGLILPLYPQMTEQEQDRVVEALREALHA